MPENGPSGKYSRCPERDLRRSSAHLLLLGRDLAVISGLSDNEPPARSSRRSRLFFDEGGRANQSGIFFAGSNNPPQRNSLRADIKLHQL